MRARKCTGIIAAMMGLCGCPADPLVPGPPDGGPPSCQDMAATIPTAPKLDVLFMLDNSNGAPEVMHQALANRISRLIAGFERLAQAGVPLDVHFGVITSDYGAGATGAPGCSQSPGGQRGRLQGVGVKAPQACKKPVGANFVRYAFGVNGPGPNNLPDSQTLEQTLQCMSAVGASGCGFEHVLESVYAALTADLPENAGFLRDDAVLAVFFITNEDDASAPPDTDVFDKNKTSLYGYEDSYSRQTRFGVVCCPPGRADCTPDELIFPPYNDSRGPLAGCVPAPNDPTGAGPGRLFDVRRYMQLKPDRNNLILLGVIGPTTPFEVILSNPGTPSGQAYTTCSTLAESTNPPCVPVLQHACQDPMQPEFVADPAVRLDAVIRSTPWHLVESACVFDYSKFLDSAAELIARRFLTPSCPPMP